MKTKLTALLLLIVMVVSVLTGCAYDYQKKDLSAYVTVDAEALHAALQALVIEDGDFTNDPETRKEKTLRQFASALASAIKGDEDRKKTDGAIASGDYVTYLYHCIVADNDGVNHTVSTGYMANGKGPSILLSGNTGVALQIEKALTGVEISNLCKETILGELPATGLALISYTYSTNENTTESKRTNVLYDLSNTEDAFVKALFDRHATKKIRLGTEFATGKGEGEAEDAKIVVTEGDLQTTYSKITVHSIIEGSPVTTWDDEGEEKPIVDSPYLEYTAEELLQVDIKDMFGAKVSVTKGTTFQYRLYPVSCIGIPDLSEANESGAVQEILFSILADKITINDMTIFKSEEYKTAGDDAKTLAELLAALVADTAAKVKAETARDTAKTAYDKAETAVTTAQTAYDEAAEEDKAAKEEALNEAKEARDEAKTALDEAEAALTTAEEKVDPATVIASLTACVNEDGETAVSAIYDEYYKGLYDQLESAYNNEILGHIYEAVGEALFKCVEYTGTLPEKAVKEALKRNLNAYEYNYYEGTDETSQKAYDELYATETLYLCAMAKAYNGKEVTTKREAKAVLREEAEEQVKEALAVYAIADALQAKYEDAELELDKDSAKNYAELQAYLYNQQILQYYTQLFGSAASGYDFSSMYVSADYYIALYGETNLRTAYLADLILAFATETKKASDAEDFGGADAIDFKNIAYTIAPETTPDGGDAE